MRPPSVGGQGNRGDRTRIRMRAWRGGDGTLRAGLVRPMRIVVLSSRFPWPAYTGDRLRATIWLAALRDHDVVLVAPDGLVPEGVAFQPAQRSIRSAFAGVIRVLRGAPFQSLIAAQYDWRDAIERAGKFDAAIVLLSRLDASVRHLLPCRRRILDAVDSLSRSMNERAKRASIFTRWFWSAEARRVERAEDDGSRAYDRVIVVSDDESEKLHATAIGNGVAIAPLDGSPRTYDFGFWGRLAYFANADAVSWLLREIWPRVRAQLPHATLLIAGADAPPRLRAAHGRDGVSVQSPVDDIAATARQIRVALFPIRYGTGQSNKVLEAAEAACAIVATTHAMRGLEPLTEHSRIANDADGLARAAVDAVANASARGAVLRAVVERHYSREETLRRLAKVAA